MKLVQPEGPYNLGAHSSGGVVAYEILAQLERDHQDKVRIQKDFYLDSRIFLILMQFSIREINFNGLKIVKCTIPGLKLDRVGRFYRVSGGRSKSKRRWRTHDVKY